jgi:thiamine transporter ThiT
MSLTSFLIIAEPNITAMIIGALLISTDQIQNIRTGGLIVLISAMVSLFTISDRYYGYAYGYFLGFLGGVLLSIIGSILALAWKPKLTFAQRNP